MVEWLSPPPKQKQYISISFKCCSRQAELLLPTAIWEVWGWQSSRQPAPPPEAAHSGVFHSW